MDDSAWIYIPRRCKTAEALDSQNVEPLCKLVVALHGCKQYQRNIRLQFVNGTGLNQWADANGIIILYPQTKPNLLNPKGCWDWWGYTGTGYASKLAPQMRSIMRMVNHILGKTEANDDTSDPVTV